MRAKKLKADIVQSSTSLNATVTIMDDRKDEIVDQFEKKSAALLEYLNSLEAAYERQRLEFQHREAQFKREKAELKYMLEAALERNRKLEVEKAMVMKEKERALERVQELEARNEELRQEMQRKEELYNYRRKKDERARRKLLIENKALKKKATVGWMLGSLCEVYLEGGADGGTLPLILMLRKLQKDLERETVNYDCGVKITTESVSKEVKKLFNDGSGSPRIEVRIQGSRAGSLSDESRKASPRARSPKGCSPCSQRGRSATPRDRSPCPFSRPRSPYSQQRDRSPVRSHTSPRPRSVSRGSHCSIKTRSRSPSPCTTLTVNFDDMPEEPGSRKKQAFAEIKVVKDEEPGSSSQVDVKNMLASIEANISYLLESERKRRWREAQFGSSPKPRTKRG